MKTKVLRYNQSSGMISISQVLGMKNPLNNLAIALNQLFKKEIIKEYDTTMTYESHTTCEK